MHGHTQRGHASKHAQHQLCFHHQAHHTPARCSCCCSCLICSPSAASSQSRPHKPPAGCNLNCQHVPLAVGPCLATSQHPVGHPASSVRVPPGYCHHLLHTTF
jgi:hypothetical protein